jgi:hypothetical protein
LNGDERERDNRVMVWEICDSCLMRLGVIQLNFGEFWMEFFKAAAKTAHFVYAFASVYEKLIEHT